MGVIKALLLPPASLLLIALAGLFMAVRGKRSGAWVATISVALLYLMSTPIFGTLALGSLESPYVDPTKAAGVQAIVVLGGGTVGPAPEYASDTVNGLTLARLRYAARLHRLTGQPILVAGGGDPEVSPEAHQMREVLAEMKVPVQWLEDRSVNTYTNALESYRILAPQNIVRVYLVTHAWHMPRARLAFEHAGFSVVPAPTGFNSFDLTDLAAVDFLPRASALLNSYYFCHEVVGYAAYALRILISRGRSGEANEVTRQMG